MSLNLLQASSRRQFLKASSLLAVGALLTPAMASLFSDSAHSTDFIKPMDVKNRSDVRSLDFDSHNIVVQAWQKY